MSLLSEAVSLIGQPVRASTTSGEVLRGRLRWVSDNPTVGIDTAEGLKVVSITVLEKLDRAGLVCRCGHPAKWHAHGGGGECEFGSTCVCQAFTEPTS